MADEPISFTVSDNGSTERLIELLKALGLTGDEAIRRLETALPAYVNAAKAAEDQQKLMNVAILAGVKNTEILRDAVNQLSDVELHAAVNSREVTVALQNLGVAEQAAELKAKQAAQALEQQSYAAKVAANEAAGVARQQSQGQSVAQAYRDAHYRVVEAHTATATSATSVTKALQSASGALTSLTAGLGIYVSAQKVLHDIDAYESIKMSLAAVKRQGEDTNATFLKLGEIAAQTQQPFEALAKSFSQIQGALLKTSDGGKSAIPVVENLARAFYVTQTPAAAASRVLHDFAEAMSQGNLQGQQLKSALMQAPQLMALFSEALGKNVSSLTAHAQHTNNLKDRLKELENRQQSHTTTVFAATGAVQHYQNSVTNLTKDIASATAKQEAYTNAGAGGARQAAALANQIEALNESRRREQLGLNNATAALSKAKAAEEAAIIKKEEHIKKTLQMAESLSRENIIAVLTSENFRNAINRLAADANGTVRGAFEALNTRFIMWLHTTGTADATVKIFNTTLDILGRNLNFLIPVLGVFFAVLGLGAAASAINSMRLLATAISQIGIVAAAGRLLLNPYVLAIAAVAFAVYQVVTALAQLLPATDNANKSTSLWAETVKLLSKAWEYFKETLNAFLVANAPLIDAVVADFRKAWDGLTKAVNDFIAAFVPGVTKSTEGTVDLKNAFEKLWEVVKPGVEWTAKAFGTLIVSSFKVVVDTVSFLIGLMKSLFEWITSCVNAYKQMGNAAASAQAGQQPVNISAGEQAYSEMYGAARNGASWTVPGSSGVDSRYIAVSPGERVTVMTPAQSYGHVSMPSSPPVRAAFRDGGVYNPTKTASESLADIHGTHLSNNRAAHVVQVIVAAASSAVSKQVMDNATAVDAVNAIAQRFANSVSSSSSSSATTASGATKDKRPSREVTAVGGVSKPSDNLAWSPAQALMWVKTNGGEIVPNPNVPAYMLTFADDVRGLNKSRDVNRFRDGGSFVVPGGSGVDTRMIQLAASPGEEVSVKTPAQRYADEKREVSRHATINFNVVTNDANSFRRSQSQINSDLKRQLSKV